MIVALRARIGSASASSLSIAYYQRYLLALGSLDPALGNEQFVVLAKAANLAKGLSPGDAFDPTGLVFETKRAEPIAFLTIPNLKAETNPGQKNRIVRRQIPR